MRSYAAAFIALVVTASLCSIGEVVYRTRVPVDRSDGEQVSARGMEECQKMDAPAEPIIRICGGLLYADSRILLGKRTARRTSYPNVWDMPGGHSEPGESLDETLVREMQEEIGITATATTRVATVCIPAAATAAIELHVYVVTKWDGVVRNRQPEEHDEIRWFTIDEACRLPLASPQYPALFRALPTFVCR